MTKFHFGILVGFFLGTLVIFVVLGTISLYFEKRRENSALARQRAARGILDSNEGLSYSTATGPQMPPVPGPGETGGLND